MVCQLLKNSKKASIKSLLNLQMNNLRFQIYLLILPFPWNFKKIKYTRCKWNLWQVILNSKFNKHIICCILLDKLSFIKHTRGWYYIIIYIIIIILPYFLHLVRHWWSRKGQQTGIDWYSPPQRELRRPQRWWNRKGQLTQR